MTGISQEVGNFSEQVWGISMSVVNIPNVTSISGFN